MESSVSELNKRYIEVTNEDMDSEVGIEKIGVDIKHIQSF